MTTNDQICQQCRGKIRVADGRLCNICESSALLDMLTVSGKCMCRSDHHPDYDCAADGYNNVRMANVARFVDAAWERNRW